MRATPWQRSRVTTPSTISTATRFVLGLGVSHVPLVEGFRGHTYAKPVATMRAYLDAMDAAELAMPAQERNVVLAALGPAHAGAGC